MIYDFPCTSCLENGMNSDSVNYCENCNKQFCSVCVKMHDRILKEHKVLDKSLQHLWSKESDDANDTIGIVQHKLFAKGNDTYVNIVRGNVQCRSQQQLLTNESAACNPSVQGPTTESTMQEIHHDRPKLTQAKEIFGEILDSPLSKLCGIVGKANLFFDHEYVRLQHTDRKACVKIPLNMIRRYGYMKGLIFYIEVGRRFRFGEGFLHTKCCSREDAKLANSYVDEVSKRKTAQMSLT